MIRLAIVAEGQTEAEFVSGVLADHLMSHNVHSTPVVMDGNVSTQRLARFMARPYGSHNAVTPPPPPRRSRTRVVPRPARPGRGRPPL